MGGTVKTGDGGVAFRTRRSSARRPVGGVTRRRKVEHQEYTECELCARCGNVVRRGAGTTLNVQFPGDRRTWETLCSSCAVAFRGSGVLRLVRAVCWWEVRWVRRAGRHHARGDVVLWCEAGAVEA